MSYIMQYARTNDTYLIRLEVGEFVGETLRTFAKAQGVQNGYFTGIGAVDTLTCGYYELTERRYHFTDYTDMVEVVSLTGNVTLKDGEPFIHMHGVFTDTTNQAFGGHIVDMRVGVTLEVVLTPLPSAFMRVPDEYCGLALIDLPEHG